MSSIRMGTQPNHARSDPPRAALQRFALQVQAGFAGVIALSLAMLVWHG